LVSPGLFGTEAEKKNHGLHSTVLVVHDVHTLGVITEHDRLIETHTFCLFVRLGPAAILTLHLCLLFNSAVMFKTLR